MLEVFVSTEARDFIPNGEGREVSDAHSNCSLIRFRGRIVDTADLTTVPRFKP